MTKSGRTTNEINQEEFDKVVQQISCEHLLTRYSHITMCPDADNLRELDMMARKGNCQFYRKCKYQKAECGRFEPPAKITYGLPKVPSGKLYRIDDDEV